MLSILLFGSTFFTITFSLPDLARCALGGGGRPSQRVERSRSEAGGVGERLGGHRSAVVGSGCSEGGAVRLRNNGEGFTEKRLPLRYLPSYIRLGFLFAAYHLFFSPSYAARRRARAAAAQRPPLRKIRWCKRPLGPWPAQVAARTPTLMPFALASKGPCATLVFR